MRIFVLTANYELRVSGKSHLRDHPTQSWPTVRKARSSNLGPAPPGGLCLLSDSNEDFPEDLGECDRMNICMNVHDKE